MTASLYYGAATDTGLLREHNEDTYIVLPEHGLWVVADGMGGHNCGEVASAIVIMQIAEQIKAGANLTDALQSAHQSVLSAVMEDIGKPGMGSTAVALRIESSQYQIAWVGDSRAYLWHDHSLKQLSHDHSVVQQMLDSGEINEQQAINHPYRNIITQSLGSTYTEQVKVDSVNGELSRDDKILLCSDGLTGEVSDQQIAEILNSAKDNQGAVQHLINQALDNGGSDNITVLLISLPEI